MAAALLINLTRGRGKTLSAEARSSDVRSLTVDQRGANAGGNVVAGDFVENLHIYNQTPELADEKIREHIRLLRSSRFLAEYDRQGEARKLAGKCLHHGQLASGSKEERSRALAWCARLLSNDNPTEAKELISQAKALDENQATKIAEAFIVSKEAGKAAALAELAKIDAPSARTAALFVVSQHDGKQQILEWYKKTELTPNDFDADGKNLILEGQLLIGDLDAAAITASECTDVDCEECPLLWLNRAFVDLLKITPQEFRQLALVQVPFEMGALEPAASEEALTRHRHAQKLFARAADHLVELGLPNAAEVAEGYDLWLSLTHPECHDQAKERLRTLLRDSSQWLKYVPFALNFSVVLDLSAVEKEIDKQVALNGGATSHVAMARLSLATTKSPGEAERYIERHASELEPHINPKALAFLRIEMLARSGQGDRARLLFDELASSSEISGDDRQRLEFIMNRGTSTDLASDRLRLYTKSGSINDLKSLIDLLEERSDWERAIEFATKLHSDTKSLSSAERLVNALVQGGHDERALEFLDNHSSLLIHSSKLRSLRAWASYRSGDLLEAKAALAGMASSDPKNYRALRRNIAVASGDWNQLSQFVAEDAVSKEHLSAEQLLQSAFLAYQIGAPAANDLLFAAAQKGHSDANLLAAAYFLATNVGLEENPEVTAWLHLAAQLSGDDGPIYTTSLEEILAKQPQWNERRQSVTASLQQAEAPMFVAAESLNRSLVSMMLTPLLGNQIEDDPRRRVAIPAFSGKRPREVAPLPKSLGIDVSALLTLGGLGLLDVLTSIDAELHISHSTLGWLFEERKDASFHQPSRVGRAQNLQDLVLNGKLLAFTADRSPDYALAIEVGDELAELVGQAEAALSNDPPKQSYVVRPFPVPVLRSSLKENADLRFHASVLVSCTGVVEKLARLGRLTAEEAKRSRSYLQLAEQKWPDEPEVLSHSDLYLDAVAVDYLQTCGVLEKLTAAGFRVYVSTHTIDEARELIAYERLSGSVIKIIEETRERLKVGISSGRIRLGPIDHREGVDDESLLRRHPTYGIFSLASRCDAILIDDRSLNRHEFVSVPTGSRCAVLTTLDLVRALSAAGLLEDNRYRDLLTRLRRGGYLFVDVDADEVLREISACEVVNEAVQESAELRGIRESFLFTAATSMLEPQSEAPWLDRNTQAFVVAYRRLWSNDGDFAVIAAKALWLLHLIDMRSWLHCFPYEHAREILHAGRERLISALIVAPPALSDERKEMFFQWVDIQIIEPLQREDADLYQRIVDAHKQRSLVFLDTFEFDGAGAYE